MGRPLRDHQIAVKTHYRRNQQWYNLMLTSSERSIGTGEVDLDIRLCGVGTPPRWCRNRLNCMSPEQNQGLPSTGQLQVVV